MLQMEKKDYQILQQILKKYPNYSFYAYGSRVKGTARKFSDLDICYYDNVPFSVISQIEEELENSDLPFIVELVNRKHMRPVFWEMIKKDLIKLES